MTGKGISNCVIGARDKDNITCKLRDVGEMEVLSGGPRRRGAEQDLCQGLVICEKGKFTTLQEKTEMADGGVGCQEFSVKGGVFGFGRGKLLGEKG